MGIFTGDLKEVAMTKETTRGVAVNPISGDWIKIKEVKPEEKYVEKEDLSRLGVMSYAEGQRLLTKEYSMSLTGNVERKQFPKLLMQVLGSVATQTNVPSTGAYTHTFTRLDSNALPSYSFTTKDPVTSVVQHYLTACQKLGISFKVEDYLEWQADIMGAHYQAASGTPGYPTVDNIFLPWMATIKQASTVAGLAGASAASVMMMDINFERPAKGTPKLGSQEFGDLVSGPLKVSGSITMLYDATTFKTMVQADQNYQALSITLTDTGTTVGVATNPSIAITIPKASLSNWKENVKADYVEQTFEFLAIRDDTNGDVSVVVINDVTAF